MKKTLRMFGMVMMAVMLSITFTSCDEDDDDEPKGNEELVGTWFCEVDDEDGTGDVTLTLNADHTYRLEDNYNEVGYGSTSYVVTGSWLVSNNTLVLTPFEGTGDYDPDELGVPQIYPFFFIEGKLSFNGLIFTRI